jgi:beta-ureidopropionase / N-carbamoyl-L-amino-acid hydrolase
MRGPAADGDRLWRSLMDMALVGATPDGGCRREALTAEDRAGRDVFVRWAEEAGCDVTIDVAGNIFARWAGDGEGAAPALAAGSHLDTQPNGGRFDGVFGVLAALEAVRTLRDHGVRTRAPLDVVVWANEEGARFPWSCSGSACFTGALALDEARELRDAAGLRYGDELVRNGIAGDAPLGGRPLAAYLEAHIEQGPVLERHHTTIGVVTGIQGYRWWELVIEGVDAHAGPTPMEGRRDALLGAAAVVQLANRLALSVPNARATVGELDVHPNAHSVVPGRVRLVLDLRHPDLEALDHLQATVRAECERVLSEAGLGFGWRSLYGRPPIPFDGRCCAALEAAARSRGYTCERLYSGAGHDAGFLAAATPTAMLFIPCENGISHNPAESATPEHVSAGAQVLLDTLLELDHAS